MLIFIVLFFKMQKQRQNLVYDFVQEAIHYEEHDKIDLSELKRESSSPVFRLSNSLHSTKSACTERRRGREHR